MAGRRWCRRVKVCPGIDSRPSLTAGLPWLPQASLPSSRACASPPRTRVPLEAANLPSGGCGLGNGAPVVCVCHLHEVSQHRWAWASTGRTWRCADLRVPRCPNLVAAPWRSRGGVGFQAGVPTTNCLPATPTPQNSQGPMNRH